MSSNIKIPDLDISNFAPNLNLFAGLSIQTVILIIYVLLIVDASIMLITIYIKLSYFKHQRKYNLVSEKLLPILNSGDEMNDIIEQIKDIQTYKNKKLIFECLTDFSIIYNKSFREVFASLGYTDTLLKQSEKKLTPENVKWFGLMNIPESIPILLEGTKNKDFELSFHCYQSLAKIDMSKEARLYFLERLFNSNNLRDRMIEMILDMKLSTKEYLELLEHQETELAKTVMLRVLALKIDSYTPQELVDKLLPYLEDTKEVKIGSITAIANSKNSVYFEPLKTLYFKETFWEVRSAIAKAMHSFSHEDEIMLLKQMTKDENWWVRFNASEVLSRKGKEGVNALIDISLDTEDEEASKLAFSFLDTNKNIHDTVTESVSTQKSDDKGDIL